MWFRTVVAGLALIFLTAATTATTTASDPAAGQQGRGATYVGELPNIVLVMTDDMRDDDLVHMPITRRLLVEQGLEFSDAVSPHPLCCPARASLVTGQYAQNNGVQHNRGPHGGFKALDPQQEISTWFRKRGYRTGFVGKFLNGFGPRDPAPAGWTSWNALTRKVYDYETFTMTKDGVPERHDGDYVTDVIAERTNALVRRFARAEEPFLLYAWHLAPHYRIGPDGREPPLAARSDRGRFRQALPRAAKRRAVDPRALARQPGYFRDRRPVPGRMLRVEHRRRLQSLQAVDRAVGTLVDTLEQEGVLDDTYLVFTSDNGFLLGEHRFIGKNVLSEPALQVPLVVRGPGVPAGTSSGLPVTLVDLPATFADLGDVEPGWSLDGQSLVPTLRGEQQEFRDTTLIQTGANGGDGWAYRGVRTDRYLYARAAGEFGVLYDRWLDPAEDHNLYGDAAYAEVQDALESRRLALLDCRGDACHQSFGPLPEPRPVHEAPDGRAPGRRR